MVNLPYLSQVAGLCALIVPASIGTYKGGLSLLKKARESKQAKALAATRLHNAIETIETISQTLKPNGGSSIRDAINRIDLNTLGAVERVWLLVDRSDDAHYETDGNGLCTRVNRQWCADAGISAQEAKGYGWILGIHPDDREKVKREWDTAINEKRIFDFEFRMANSRYVHSRANPIKDEKGCIMAWIGTNDAIA